MTPATFSEQTVDLVECCPTVRADYAGVDLAANSLELFGAQLVQGRRV